MQQQQGRSHLKCEEEWTPPYVSIYLSGINLNNEMLKPF